MFTMVMKKLELKDNLFKSIALGFLLHTERKFMELCNKELLL